LTALEAAVSQPAQRGMPAFAEGAVFESWGRALRNGMNPVANAKRVSRIEVALTPKQAVMLWLSQEQQGRTSVEICRDLLQLPRSAAPRSKVGAQVAMAIRTAMKGQDSERIAQAVRQARMEADFLLLLINRANFLVLDDKQVRWLKIVLLYERRRNLALSENGAEDLDEFVKYLRTTAIEIQAMQAATKAIQEQDFDGQEILVKDAQTIWRNKLGRRKG